MSSRIVVAIALAMFIMAGCSRVDPLSAPAEPVGSQPAGIAPGEPHADAFLSFEHWLQTDIAADLNGDEEITEADFRLFLAVSSPVLEPGDEPGVTPDRLPGTIAARPALFVTGDRSEAARMADFLGDPALQAVVQATDFDDNWLLVAFRGQVSTAGYGIEIEQVEYDGRSVRIWISLSDPAPGEVVAQVISSPFAVRVIPRQAVPIEEPTTWLMSTEDGGLQAKIRYPYDPTSAGTGAAVPGSGGEPGIVVIDPVAPGEEDPDGANADPFPTTKIDIRGSVTEISVPASDNEEIVAVILIGGQVEEDTNVDKAWLTVTTGTFVGYVEGDDFVKVPFSEIEPGQSVEAIFAGPVAESYPLQANARALLNSAGLSAKISVARRT
jgi:hypothetical protein